MPHKSTLSREERFALESCIARTIPGNSAVQVYLIGSMSRYEGTFEYAHGKLIPLSDVELYCIFKTAEDMKYLANLRQAVQAEIPDYKWDINGNTYPDFMEYSPRQWLIDGGITGDLLFKQNFDYGNLFLKYAAYTPTREDLSFLLLNRIAEMSRNGKDSFWNSLKLCLDLASVMTTLAGYYTPYCAKRYVLFATQIDILESKLGISETSLTKFCRIMNKCLQYKIKPDIHSRPALESLLADEAEFLKSMVRKTLQLLQGSPLSLQSNSITGKSENFISHWIIRNRGTKLVKDWVRNFKRDTKDTVLFLLKYRTVLSPLFYSYKLCLDGYLSGRYAEKNTFHLWRKYCKNI